MVWQLFGVPVYCVYRHLDGPFDHSPKVDPPICRRTIRNFRNDIGHGDRRTNVSIHLYPGYGAVSGIFSYPETARVELRHFKRAIVQNPLFALWHFPAVTGFYARKYLLRFEAMLRADSLSVGKMPPSWLPGGAIDQLIAAPDAICARIPLVTSRSGVIGSSPLWKEKLDEPEDYFAAHRFAWLLISNPSNLDVARETRTLLGEWISRQRDLADRAWEPYSACERVCNLISWLSLAPSEIRASLFPEMGAEFLRNSAEVILKRMEYYGEVHTNNHILNNGRALVMLGCVLGSTALQAKGIAIYERMLPVIVGDDGMLRERSSHYQFVVLGWVLDTLRYVTTPEARNLLTPYSKRMAGAALRLLNERGGIAAGIGDISPDMTPLASIERLDLLHPGWREDAASVAGHKVDDWYFLSSGVSRVIVNYPEGHYPPRYPTHGHCDLTSFVWSFGGERVLTDAGRYRYTTDAVSERQRSAAGHNVPLVDGFSPLCEPFGVSGWAPVPYASTTLEAECPTPRQLLMRHTGLERVQRGMRHERVITVLDNGVDVEDSFTGTGEHAITLLWHFPPAFTPCGNGKGLSNGHVEVTVEIVGGVETSYHCLHGENAVVHGSIGYGDRGPLTTVVVERRAAFPVSVKTQFRVQLCAV